MEQIADFVPHAPVEPEVIEAYRNRVPAELVELWETHGYGTFGHGFFRVINPQRYEDGIGDLLGKVTGNRIAIPIMVTGLADIVSWEPGHGLVLIRYRDGDTTGLVSSLDDMLFMIDADGEEELSDTYDWDMFPKAVEAHGAPAFDESFTYVPLLSLAGEKKVENMRARKTIEAIRTMVEFQGVIEH